jgi:GntR family transcriptional regulator
VDQRSPRRQEDAETADIVASMQIRTTTSARPRADNARMVADVVRRQINDGELVGTLDEAVLIEDFSVSRNTIRDALAILRDEGLIERSPRVGTHVVARKLDHGLDALLGLKETFVPHGEVRNVVRIATIVTPPTRGGQKAAPGCRRRCRVRGAPPLPR